LKLDEVYGTACCVVEVDVLTGNYEILSTDICFDLGKSMNPLLDIGQIEGGFMQVTITKCGV